MIAKKRLVFFGVKYFPSRGGVSRTTENLIRNLKDKYDITIYCYKHPYAEKNVPGVKTIQIPEIGLGGIGVFLYFLFCCLHMLIIGKYDLVHLRKIDAAFFLPLIRIRYKKVLATSHERTYLSTKWSFLARTFFMFNERIFINSPATLSAISKPICDYYMQEYGREVYYIPNGVSQTESLDEKEADRIIDEHKVSKEYLFFSARRIMATKGLHTLLDALSFLDYHGDILVAGEISHDKEYMRKLEHHKNYHFLKFIGYISNKMVLLDLARKSTLLIFPSESEGMSIMLLEAAGNQTPIVCSDISANKAIFTEAEVLFFKSKNARDLADQINWALANNGEMMLKAEKARERTIREYSDENMTRQYETIYERILNSDI